MENKKEITEIIIKKQSQANGKTHVKVKKNRNKV